MKCRRTAREPGTKIHRRDLLLTVLLVVLLVSSGTIPAQIPNTPTELQVKAAYLYKFGAFVQWPTAVRRESFPVCVLGRDPFGQTLDSTLSGGSVDGVSVVPVRIPNAQDAAQCRIVFISESEQSRLPSILQVMAHMPVLTVGDMPRFADQGGMIQFVLENGRVRFEVNLTSAEKAGLGLSSQLLKVASLVKRNGGGD